MLRLHSAVSLLYRYNPKPAPRAPAGMWAFRAAALLCLAGALMLPARPSPASASSAPPGRGQYSAVVYQPSDPSQYAGYPRVIRLAYSGRANGTLLATFDVYLSGTDRLVIYRSADDGRSWSHLATIADAAYGGRMCCATIFELPRTLGSLAAGTLLAAESAGAAGAVGHAIKVFSSQDHGRTWTYLSLCAQGAGGLWEPDFAIDASGHLVCYFSDERRVDYSQFLGHVVSADGGRSWGAEVLDVAVSDGSSRPGMATVLRLPRGQYVMSFEVCGQVNCAVHVKISRDGDRWGSAGDLGSRVQTADGRYAGHTPYLTWMPGSAPHGELLLTSQDLFTPDGLVASESRTVLLTNTNGGSGPWTAIAAPMRIAQGGPDCANYSSALLPSAGGTLIMVAGVGLSGGGCAIRFAKGTVPTIAPPGPA